METLHAAFGVDEAARGFGERCNGQQHVAEFHVGLERAQRDHHFHLAPQPACHPALSNSGSLFSSNSRLQPTRQHLRRHSGRLARQCAPDQLRAHGVGRFGQVAHGGAGLLPIQLASASRLDAWAWCAAALPSNMALRSPRQQRLGDGLAAARRHDRATGALTPFSCATAAATSASACTHLAMRPPRCAQGMAQSPTATAM
jgi:hypothetical protein